MGSRAGVSVDMITEAKRPKRTLTEEVKKRKE